MNKKTQTLKQLVGPFLSQIASGRTTIYNEFSLQHELGIYLRLAFPNLLVQFERNVRSFFPNSSSFTKHEIDISVLSSDSNELKWAIELKFPRNGQYPEQMFSFCRDILFAEQLKAAGFASAGVVIVADDPPFWSGNPQGIYGYFRGGNVLHGLVTKPTGRKDAELNISGSYVTQWEDITKDLRAAVIEAS